MENHIDNTELHNKLKCKLCNNSTNLIKAHIFPNWIFKEICENNYAYSATTANFKKGRKVQTGVFDKNILCANCDNMLGRLDDYGNSFFKHISNLLEKECLISENNFYVLGSNYFELRQFLVSLLWRSSISKRDEFLNVSLGNYEKISKEIIFDKILYPEYFNYFLQKIDDCQNEKLKKVEIERTQIFPEKTRIRNSIFWTFTFLNYTILIQPSNKLSDLKIILQKIHDEYNINGILILNQPFYKSQIWQTLQKINF